MARRYDAIEPHLVEWISRQRMFFVATAPLAADGHVNASPKGLDTLRVLGPLQVAYLDLTGSSAETVAHLNENGRITLMFCAFEGPPRIVRLHGTGRVAYPGDSAFDDVAAMVAPLPGARAVVVVDVERVSDSCGYGVPLYEYQGQRERLVEWAEAKGPDGLVAYQAAHNRTSLDGLPALAGPVPQDAPA